MGEWGNMGMKIAICDDKKDCEAERRLLSEFGDGNECRCYIEKGKVIEDIKRGKKIDVLLMRLGKDDACEMIELAEEACGLYSGTHVIFVADHAVDFIEEIFCRDINVEGILKRPVSLNVLKVILLKIDKKISRNRRFAIRQNGNVFVEDYNNVIFCECRGHDVIVRCTDGEYSVYTSMRNIEENLPLSFYRCHKSFIINMKFIKRIEKQELELMNGYVIYVSKARVKKLKQRYEEYLSNMY